MDQSQIRKRMPWLRHSLGVIIVGSLVFNTMHAAFADDNPAISAPTARELLDRFEADRPRFKSFIMEWETHVTEQGRYPPYRGPLDFWDRVELRYDGARFRSRAETWGNFDPAFAPFERGKGPYNSLSWDGQHRFQLTCGRPPRPGDPARGTLYVQTISDFDLPGELTRRQNNVEIMDQFHGDQVSIAQRLRETKRVRARAQPEIVGGSPCWVIEADSRCGKYTVWLDANHGYHMARARVERTDKRGMVLGEPVQKSVRFLMTVDEVRFEKMDDLWVPMEGTYTWRWTFPVKGGGQGFIFDTKHIVRKKLILNPDHEALRSFVPDDIQDGTPVHYGPKMQFKAVWKDGKAWDGDKVVIEPAAAKPVTREASATCPVTRKAIAERRSPPLRQKGRPR